MGVVARACSIPDLLAAQAEARPEAPALLDADGAPLGYGRLWEHVCAVAGALRSRGIGRKDRVAVVLPNGPEAATAFLGVACAAACAPLNPTYRRQEFDFYFTDMEPKALIVDGGDAGPAREAARERGIPVLDLPSTRAEAGHDLLSGAGDVALVLHTSGTTARPKLVPLTHANLCASAANVAEAVALGQADRCLNVMPLFHIHGLVGAVLASLYSGGSVVCTPGFHAPSFFTWLDRLEPTWYTAVPTIHQAVLARATREKRASVPSRLRFVRSSSAALPRQVAEELETVLGVPAIEAYGMTEAAHQIASNPLPPGERRVGSVGRATGLEVAVLDPVGARLAQGAIGEVAIRGESVFSGYEDNPEANREAFADGWFRTGDEGFLDKEDYLYLRGRLKEIINRGGEKIAPGEVEEALLAHPAVAEAVAFAMPDERLGEEVAAAIVVRDGASVGEQELQAFVGDRLADFKVPRAVAVVDRLPKGATGKLQRRGLAERLGLGSRPTPTERAERDRAPQTELERVLAALWAELLGLDEVSADDDFFALGGDSILAAELVARLRAEHGAHELSLTTMVWAPTVAALAAELGQPASRPSAALVPIQTTGARPPLFFVHALDGEVVRFGALARRLGPEQPFYGLRALGLGTGKPEHGRIEDMAADYLAEVRAVRPHGPYLLGALCMGAGVALEMARSLIADGEQVGLLALVDPRVTACEMPPLRPAAPARLWAHRSRVSEVGGAFMRRMEEIRDRYVMTPYPGRATVYVTEPRRVRLNWLAAVQGGVDAHELGGKNREVLRPPLVDRLAALLSDAIREVAP